MTDLHKKLSALSPRQMQVLQHVSDQRTSKEIARLLGISPATVDSHVAMILKLLELDSRQDAGRAFRLVSNPSEEASAAIVAGDGSDPLQDPHHGDGQPYRSSQITSQDDRNQVTVTSDPAANFEGATSRTVPPKTGTPHARRRVPGGMGHVVLRSFLDAFYVTFFFGVMALAALGVHEIMVFIAKQPNADKVVVFILKYTSYGLVAVDAVGVICAVSLLMFRFVRAIFRVDD